MLDQEQIRTIVADMVALHRAERVMLDRIYEYVTGMRGAPDVPEGAGREVKDLAALSIKNVLGMVRDSFVENLSVTGYRNAWAQDNNAAWEIWQRNRMDARQAEVYRPAGTYGAAYVVVVAGEDGSVWRTRSPRQLLAVYEDPQIDLWPQYAFEMWIDQTDAKPRRRAVLYDDTYMYPLELGPVPVLQVDNNSANPAVSITEFGEPVPHGATMCPVVRFVNARDPDDMIVGEIAPLIRLQQALNEVNFDRLITTRFGAFPQKVISGWSGSSDQVLAASARRVWTFEDSDVTTQSFPAADPGNFNGVIEEMLNHIAMVAQISPAQVTGKLVNLSAEALAASEANQQRKLAAKRESFGESWEQTFRLAAYIEGSDMATTAADESAEVQWRDTEARAFGAIVDGITKLAAAGVPIEELVDMIPGTTQQKVVAIKTALRRNTAANIVSALNRPPAPALTSGAG